MLMVSHILVIYKPKPSNFIKLSTKLGWFRKLIKIIHKLKDLEATKLLTKELPTNYIE